MSARDAAAAAALKRAETSGGQGESDAKAAERRAKNDLIGKIEMYYGSIAKVRSPLLLLLGPGKGREG